MCTHLPELHSSPAPHVPQLAILLPQPSAACPHWIPCAAQVLGMQVSGTHFPETQALLAGQAGQVSTWPHASPAWPHSSPRSVQLLGLQLLEPHLPLLQVWPDGHVPQLATPLQPSLA